MGEVTIDYEYQKALEAVAEAASDYRLATASREFAKLNGGTQKLKDTLFEKVSAWESLMSEMADVV